MWSIDSRLYCFDDLFEWLFGLCIGQVSRCKETEVLENVNASS